MCIRDREETTSDTNTNIQSTPPTLTTTTTFRLKHDHHCSRTVPTSSRAIPHPANRTRYYFHRINKGTHPHAISGKVQFQNNKTQLQHMPVAASGLQCKTPNTNLYTVPISVSYTHLDVYRRQPSPVTITYSHRSHSHTRPKTEQGISHLDM